MTKECPNCGEKNPENSAFCKNCGNDLKEVTKVQKSPKSGPMGWWKNQSNLVKGLSVVGVCCVGLILLLLIGSIVFPDTTTTTTATSPTSSSTSTPSVSSLETYTGSGVSFQYPKEWTEYTPEELKVGEVVNLKTTKGDTSILTVYADDDSGEDLDYWKDIIFDAAEAQGTVTSQKDLTIAGVNGYRVDSISSSGSDTQFSQIIFVKNGKSYKLLFTSGSLSAINSDIDTIVNSFKTT